MDRLITFAGYRDPFVTAYDGSIERDGPVLDLLQQRSFDSLIILRTPGASDHADRLDEEARRRHSSLQVDIVDLNLPDPTDYTAILVRLGGFISRRIERWTDDNLYVAVASGTPQMHAAWVLLVTSGQLPARILHTRPPLFVTAEKPAVEEVDFTGPVFPDVRVRTAPRAVPNPTERLDEALKAVGLVGSDETILAVARKVAQVAQTDVPILISGETGTGKELIASLAHRLSGRPHDRIVTVNAATLSGNIVDSTLFGHEKGAFTDATGQRPGQFERADSGTLFIDELGELPLGTQAKLLRVLQDGTFERVGGSETIRSTARIVAATNRDLELEIREGRFREDLYHRLATITVELPPLRQRRGDIALLATSFLDIACDKYGHRRRLSPGAIDSLRRAPWPGNIRQLKSAIDRAVLLTDGDIIEADNLDLRPERQSIVLPEPYLGFKVTEYVDGIRRGLYERAIELANGNQSEASRLLGVSPTMVGKYLRERQSQQAERY